MAAEDGRQSMRVAELVELGRVAVRTAPVPVPGPGEARMRVRAVGLCGTDVKAFRRGHPYFRPPCVLGHEAAGTIDAVGDGVRSVRVGERVVSAPYVECGSCDVCRRGAGELCEHKAFTAGALQDYLILPARILATATLTVPDSVSDDLATLAEPLACARNGVERAGVLAGDRVLIVGGGPMGALLGVLSATITSHVLVSEPNASRRGHLAKLGLASVDPAGAALAPALTERFGGPEADRVLVAVGDRVVAEEAVAWTARGGTALLFGGLPKGEPFCLDSFAIHYREVTVAGSFGFQVRHFREAVAWIAAHSDALAPIVTTAVSLDDAATAFGSAADPDGLKTVIRLHDSH